MLSTRQGLVRPPGLWVIPVCTAPFRFKPVPPPSGTGSDQLPPVLPWGVPCAAEVIALLRATGNLRLRRDVHWLAPAQPRGSLPRPMSLVGISVRQ